jgi:hypothetical protein
MKRSTLFPRVIMALFLIVVSATVIQPAQASGTASLPILLGAYAESSLHDGTANLVSLNNWLTGNGASGLTFAANFMNITVLPSYNVPAELGTAWNAGFVPFVNLMGSETWEGASYDVGCTTTAKIAHGDCDSKITIWANEFKTWAGTSKRAYIAPFPEMNSDWVYYMNGSTAADYINAFKRIRSLFEGVGVPRCPQWLEQPASPGVRVREFLPRRSIHGRGGLQRLQLRQVSG